MNVPRITNKIQIISRVKVSFLTPARLIAKGNLIQDISFNILIRTIFRRLDLLGRVHGQGPLEIDYKSWLDLASEVDVIPEQTSLSWQEWERYSNRQNTKLQMGGIIGQVIYQGHLKPFLPFFEMASIVHVGKATVFGLGKMVYELYPV